MPPEETTYALGHSKAATASHASLTAEVEAAFILPYLKPNFRILDFGCGPGTITSGFCKYVPQGHVIGIDSSAKVIAQAEHIAHASPGGKPTNLEFICMDVLKTDNGSDGPASIPQEWLGRFDMVCESQVLVHLPTPVQAIKNLRACLKPGGLFATRDYDPTSFTYWRDPSGELALWPAAISRMVARAANTSLYGGREVPFWLQEAGIERDNVSVGASALMYSTQERRQWWGELQAERLSPGNETRENMIKAGISPEQCERFRKALMEWAQTADGIFYATAIECVAMV